MPSLERFFDPQMRKFDANVRPLPGARLYFFESGTTTPKAVFQDKQGEDAHANPVIADSTGVFPQIFLDGLYRVELRSSANIVQPGWPIDNIGQDSPVVPFGPWSEIVTYATGEIVTIPNGDWYRSITNGNLGNEPSVSPTEWEVIPIPVSSSFTSDAAWITFSDDGDQISLDVDVAGMVDQIEANLDAVDGDLAVAGNLTVVGNFTTTGEIISDRSGFSRRVNSVSKSNDTTLALDPELSIDGLIPGVYQVSGVVCWNSNSGGAANGIALTLDNDIYTNIQTVVWTNYQPTPGTPEGSISVNAEFESVSSSNNIISFFGLLRLSAGGTGLIGISWAQKTSSATITSIIRGSIIATRVGDV